MAAVVGGGQTAAGERVLHENGFSFILIDGQCRYWVKSSGNQFEETRTGVLDPATLTELLDDFRYERWPELHGEYPSGVPIFDANDIVFMDREARINCAANCLGESTPAAVVAMRDANGLWNARLWAAGEAVTGAVRVSVIESAIAPESLPSHWTSSPWPASVPIESIAVPEAASEALGFGDGALVTGLDAQALRERRREFLTSHYPSVLFILIRDGDGPAYFVNVRDTTPFEDARGLIPLLHRWPG